MMMQRAIVDTTAPPPTPEEAEHRHAPHNIEAEQALLGAILVNNEALDRVIDFLEPRHFFDPLHQQVYDVACKLIVDRKQATPITLRTFFENAEPIDATLTVPQYLGRLAANAATIINAKDYGRTIHDLATRRQLILIGEDIVNVAYDSAVDYSPSEQIEEAEGRLFSLVEKGEKGGDVSFRDSTGKALASALRARSGKRTGIPTGLDKLDEKLGGMQPGNLVILAGRPGMGKSALASNIVVFNAKRGRAVGFFSLEMSGEEIALRVLGEQADVAPDALRKGTFDPNFRDRLQELALRAVADMPIHIDPTGGLSIAQLTTRARRMVRKHKIELLVVDYLQLMHAGRKTENRVQDVSAITVGLKALAKELNVPVLALSQLSRAVEGRDNKRPQLSDLRESGSIEQDADVVMFVYREEYYVERAQPEMGDKLKYEEWQKKLRLVMGKAEVIISKQRQGATGLVQVQFTGDLMRFSNIASFEVPAHG